MFDKLYKWWKTTQNTKDAVEAVDDVKKLKTELNKAQNKCDEFQNKWDSATKNLDKTSAKDWCEIQQLREDCIKGADSTRGVGVEVVKDVYKKVPSIAR